MVAYQYVSKKETLNPTVNIIGLIGKKVISKGGTIVGYVSEVRVSGNNLELQGIVIKRKFQGPIYIGKSYFSSLSNIAIILNIELNILIKGKKVLTFDGKVLGRVRKVNRKKFTNEIENLVVNSLWRKYLILPTDIKQIKSTVLVKYKYNESKNHIWKRPKQDNNL